MFARLSRPTHANAVLFLVITMALWAGNHVIGRWATGNIPPLTFAFLRWAGAGLILLPFALPSMRQEWPTVKANWPVMLLLGLLGSGYYNTIQYVALTETTATNAAILNSWAPVAIAVMGALLFGDRLSWFQIGGLCLSMLGVAVIVLRADLDALRTFAFNHGDIVMLVGTSVWATYTTLLRKRPAISTMTFSGVTYVIAGFANLPLAAYEYANGQHVVWSWASVGAIFYAMVLASVVAYFLYSRSVEIIGATRTGAFIHLIPLFTSVLAIIFLGETPQLYHALGFIMILCGVALASRKLHHRRSNKTGL